MCGSSCLELLSHLAVIDGVKHLEVILATGLVRSAFHTRAQGMIGDLHGEGHIPPHC